MLTIVAINTDADNMEDHSVHSDTGKGTVSGDARCFSPKRTHCCRVHTYIIALHDIPHAVC